MVNLACLFIDQGDVNKEAHRLGDIQATKDLRKLYPRKVHDFPTVARKLETIVASHLEDQGLCDMTLKQAWDECYDDATALSTATFSVDDYVQVYDFQSSVGRLLNGRIGRSAVRSPCGQRFGVELAIKGLKSIKPKNISLIAMPLSAPVAISLDEGNAQVAIEASLQKSSGSSVHLNELTVAAQVSDASLRSRVWEHRPHVLLKFSRSRKLSCSRCSKLLNSLIASMPLTNTSYQCSSNVEPRPL